MLRNTAPAGGRARVAPTFKNRQARTRYGGLQAVCTENLNAGVIVMQSTEERMRVNDPRPLNRARDRRIFIQ